MEFVDLRPQEGVIQLVPAFGTALSGFTASAILGVQYQALRMLGQGRFPSAVRVSYTCGFETDKIPYAIAELIELGAALNAISLISMSFQPQNSVSIGIDGVSQSTSNAGPGYFQQRMSELQAAYDKQLISVKAAYQRGFLIDYI